MEIRAEEITKVLKQQLAGFSAGTDTAEIGTVLSVGVTWRQLADLFKPGSYLCTRERIKIAVGMGGYVF